MAAEKSRGRFAELFGLAVILGQAVLVALIMRNANLETFGFHRIVYLATGGFVFHHLLPLRLRLPAFVILSIVAMLLVLGGSANVRIADLALGAPRTGAILLIGIILITICHLAIGFWMRAALLASIGFGMVIFRANLVQSGVLALVWPVLAAMFMFRIMVYLYDVSVARQRPLLSQSLAYFFLLPNVCVLLFPVIDFRTFCQKYYDEDALVIYQRGVKWMARGVTHLLLYRLIDQLWALDPADVTNGTDLIQFVFANSFLYLKVSGSFHLLVGMLLLFGFNLPETNHRYFLASSFTDYWRRVNTYWRTFIMKVFYYPAYFRFKNLGQVNALVLATTWCFFVTWALHLYQTWWVKGEVSWTWPDALFWATLAVLVLANSLWELKRNRQRKLSAGNYSLREALGLALSTAMTFAVVGILWSLWSTPTLKHWLHIWSLADRHTLAWGGAAMGCVMVATILFEVLPGRWRRFSDGSVATGHMLTPGFRRDALQCAVPLIAIFFITHPFIRSRLDSPDFQRFASVSAIIPYLVDGDVQGPGRGYYENLTTADDGTSQFLDTMKTTYGQPLVNPMRFRKGTRIYELIPNVHLEKNGSRVDTNRWGMRDRDYEPTKPPGTLRMALLGSSHVMGYALPEQDVFKIALENRLNAEHLIGGRFEIMNFAVPGQSPLGQIWLMQNCVEAFQPDIVLFVAHLVDYHWVNRDVIQSLRNHVPLADGFPNQIMARSGVDSRTLELFAGTRLRPYEPEILSFCYKEIVHKSQASKALPICVFLPLPDDLPLEKTKVTNLLQLAKNAGFVVIDLSEIYAGYDPKDLMLSDHHSNAKANAIIAAALYDRLTTDPRIDLLNRARANPGGVSVEGSATQSSP